MESCRRVVEIFDILFVLFNEIDAGTSIKGNPGEFRIFLFSYH